MRPAFGAASLAAAAALFAAWAVVSAAAGFPPPAPSALAAWAQGHELVLALANEFLFFAAFALVPGLATLVVAAGRRRPVLTLIGASALAGAVVTLLVLNVVFGRLVYPIFGLVLGPDALAFTVSAFFGGLHAFDLMVAVAVVAWGLSFDGRHRALVALSVITAVCEVLVAYPWFFGPVGAALLRLPFVAWLVFAAVVLGRTSLRAADGRGMVNP